jgi:hypothetical protein
MPRRPGTLARVLARHMLSWHVQSLSVLSWTGLARTGLAGHVLSRYVVGWHMLPRWRVALLWPRASAHALAEPQRAGPQHAAELADARQVPPVPGPQREVLVVAGQIADIRGGADGGEPVVRVRPRSSLLGIEAGRSYPRSQLRQLIAASLADGRERH